MPDDYVVTPLPPKDPTQDVQSNHYWTYHGLDSLLACKQPLTESQDEDLFIAVHQICELAMHQMILDLDRALAAIRDGLSDETAALIGPTGHACYFLDRVVNMAAVINRTMPILGGLRAFNEFRGAIGPTSGFQSFQFRHMEIMVGVDHYWKGGTANADGHLDIAETRFDEVYGDEVTRWLTDHQHHSLTHYYRLIVDKAGDVETAWEDHNARPVLALFAKVEHALQTFHQAHLSVAVRQLKLVGAQLGTGGTDFRTYLKKFNEDVAPLFPGLA